MRTTAPRRFDATPAARRSGFTLIEILIAVGILSIGMIGILSLFPVVIRNISVAVNRTAAASVAKSVVVSLDYYALDLRVVDIGDLAGTCGTIAGSSVWPLDGSRDSLPAAIKDYHDNTKNIGDGSGDPSFKIPDDVTLPPVLEAASPEIVAAVQWDYDQGEWAATDFGWSATFLPVPLDAPITDSTVYAVQIAVWRGDGVYGSIGTPTGNFVHGNRDVQISGEADEFWERVKPGDFIRHADMGLWYKIESLTPPAESAPAPPYVTLTAEFDHPPGVPAGGDVEVANRYKLVALYDMTVRP